jgi:hypothetical protein
VEQEVAKEKPMELAMGGMGNEAVTELQVRPALRLHS